MERKEVKFKFEIGQTLKDAKRDIFIVDRKIVQVEKTDKLGRKSIANLKYYKYHCKVCGFDCEEHYKNGELSKGHWIVESDLFKGNGCVCCKGLVVVEGINDIPTTAPWMVKYFQRGYEQARRYTKGSHVKISPICPDCGRIKNKEMSIKTIYNEGSTGCTCGDGVSYPEKLMFNVLEQLGVKFKTEYSPEWIKPRKYDFYFEIKNNKYIVEMDGGLGHGKKIHGFSNQTAEETQMIDDYKDQIAKEHGVEVIRIDCEKSELEYIKSNLLMSKLAHIFDLSQINWCEAEKFALSNLVKKACEIKRKNPNMTAKEIGNIMDLQPSTVIRYLKRGMELDWCYYNPKEEKSKTSSKSGKRNGKKVEVFDNIESLGVFDSCYELARQSKGVIGIELSHSMVSYACLLKNKKYKGFTFKYI